MTAETDRLNSLEQSCGKECARRFAEQTLGIYRRSVLNKRHFASQGHYRRRFIEAYIEIKTYVLNHRPARNPKPHTGSIESTLVEKRA